METTTILIATLRYGSEQAGLPGVRVFRWQTSEPIRSATAQGYNKKLTCSETATGTIENTTKKGKDNANRRDE